MRRVLAAAAVEPPLVVAASGGPDSTAVLVAVARTSEHRPDIVAACFDHRMRAAGETAADRSFVEGLVARLGVQLAAGRARQRPVSSQGPEAAAREARYRWLSRVCDEAGATTCVTGHTLDDQAETVMLRLVRGATLAGVAGMGQVSPWPVSSGRRRRARPLTVVRPLLGIRREEVLRYLVALGIEARHDPSNDLLTFDRNRIRHRVLPELRVLNPRVDESLARFSVQARADELALSEEAGRVLTRLRHPSTGSRTMILDRRSLNELPPAIVVRVLRLAAGEVGLAIDAAQAEQTEALLWRRGSIGRGGRTRLSGGWVTVRGRVVMVEADPDEA